MLIRFEVENFKNFQNRIILDFSRPSSYEFNQEVISQKYGCITKGIAYGPNGSGKSNLGLALFDIVTHLTDNNVISERYILYSCLNNKKKKVSFKYTFRFDDSELVYEYAKQSMRQLLSERITIDGRVVLDFDYGSNDGGSVLKGSENLNLSANKNDQISRVKYVIGTALLEDNKENRVFLKFADWVNHMLLFYSLDSRRYEGFSVGTESISKGIIEKGKLNDFENFLRKNGIGYSLVERMDGKGEPQIYCKMLYGEVDFFELASTGTSSLALFYYWYIQMEKASFVFIDEFDAFYHFELAQVMVQLLRGMKETQVFLTTHNTDLMSNDLLRPDCYFLIDSDRIVSLTDATDKELRKAHNLQKMYKAGAFHEKG